MRKIPNQDMLCIALTIIKIQSISMKIKTAVLTVIAIVVASIPVQDIVHGMEVPQINSTCASMRPYVSGDGQVTLRLPGDWYMTIPRHDPNGHLLVGLLKDSDIHNGYISSENASIVSVYQYDSYFDSLEHFVQAGTAGRLAVHESKGYVDSKSLPNYFVRDYWLGGEYGQVLRLVYRGKQLSAVDIERIFSCFEMRDVSIRSDLTIRGRNYVTYQDPRLGYVIYHHPVLQPTRMIPENVRGVGTVRNMVSFDFPNEPSIYSLRFYEVIADSPESHEAPSQIPGLYAPVIGDRVYGKRSWLANKGSEYESEVHYNLFAVREYHLLFLRYGLIWGKVSISTSGASPGVGGQNGIVSPLIYYPHAVKMLQETYSLDDYVFKQK